MKILSPFRSQGSSSSESDRHKQPKMRDFGSSSLLSSVANHRRRPDRFSGRHDAEDSTSSYTSPSEQPSSITDTIFSTSQYKVSEIVNPDGTVTVRNLVINEDGTWECQQEERDYHQQLDRPSSRSSAGNSYRTLQSQINSGLDSYSYSTMKSEISPEAYPTNNCSAMVPDLIPAASFESSPSSNSSDTSRAAKSRSDVSELSEGAAHELRRHRLAKNRTVAQKYGLPESPPIPTYYDQIKEDDKKLQQLPSSPKSVASSESSQLMTLMRSPIGTKAPTSPQTQLPGPRSPRRTDRTAALVTGKNRKGIASSKCKHVIFLDPTSSTDSRSVRKLSSHTPNGNDDDSSVFRNLSTPSPEGNGKIDEILGPPPDSSFLVPSASSIDDGESKNGRSGNIGGGSSKQRDGGSPRIPIEEPSIKLSTLKNRSDYAIDNIRSDNDTPFIYTVTVHKSSKGDKIGIFVGLKKFPYGKRLVVSQVAPDGKFANGGVDVGDIVVSINGTSMLEKPSSQEAFDIVHAAPDRVTFVIQKQSDSDDGRTISGSTISSISKDWGFASTPDRGGAAGQGHSRDEEKGEFLERRMTSDGSMILSKETDVSEPISGKANESWKLSGALAVSVKKSSTDPNPVIQIGTREASSGRVLFVSNISPSSPFIHTPLRIGDILLSINDIDLEQNVDVVGAYAALGKSDDEVSIVARKAADSLDEFLRNRKEIIKVHACRLCGENEATSVKTSQETSQKGASSNKSLGSKKEQQREDQTNIKCAQRTQQNRIHDVRSKSFEFEEESYGASFNGYNSSKMIKITKSHPQESIGFDLVPVATEWGNLLTISDITPRSQAAETPIRVGDAILAINGVDLRVHPNVESALSVIKRARTDVNIELQQLSLYPTDFPSKESSLKECTTILEPDNVGVVRTRTFDSNDEFLKQRETMRISGNVDHHPPRNARLKEDSDPKDPRVEKPTAPTNLDIVGDDIGPPKTKQHRKVWVAIKKEFPNEKVGISFASLERRLIVTNVSPSGLLRATPVLPGDTILSINGVDFSRDPDVKYAFELVSGAVEEVLLEILKTGFPVNVESDTTNKCLWRKFGCGQRTKQEYAVRLERYPNDEDGDTLNTELADPVRF